MSNAKSAGETQGQSPNDKARSLGLGARVLAIGCWLLASAWAGLPVEVYWGEEIRWRSARELAQAGAVGFEPAAAAVSLRPEMLGFLSRPEFELTCGAKFASEQRTQTVFDRYENSIGEAVYADNSLLSIIALPAALAYPLTRGLVLGVGLAPVLDFSYRYVKEYRDDFYVRVGEDRIEQEGRVYEASAGLGARPLPWLALGASAGYDFGSRRLETWEIEGPDTLHETEAGKPSGVGIGVGAAVAPVSRVRLSFGFRGSTGLTGWDSVPRTSAGLAEWSARAGVGYNAPGVLPSRVSAEAVWKTVAGAGASDTAVSQAGSTHHALLVQAGVEHTMLNFVKLRYGFGVEPLPAASQFDPTIQRARIGAGLGFDVGVALIDVGGMFYKDAFGPQLLRRTDSGGDSESQSKIYETRAILAVTVRRGF